jgi:hypothetical protein
MMRKIPRWLLIVGALGLVPAASLLAPAPAHAQFWGGGQGGGGFFGGLFGDGPRYAPRYYERQPRENREYEYSRPELQQDFSHAPPPRKAEKSDVAPTTSIVVMGDAMADWLAYGLEDAFADAPEVGVIRKNKTYSGLLRYDVKGDLDWWHVARDLLANEKPSYVVMMIGMNDRQNIRERDLAKEAEKEAKEKDDQKKVAEKKADEAKPADEKKTAEEKQPADSEAANTDRQSKSAEQKAPEEKKPIRQANGTLEFRSEQWERVYNKRIDETIAALKSKGVPVFWVGLPAIKGTKSTSDTSYLNSLYRARAQRAGIVFIDVWDGFVDEGGRYTSFGPDYEGQQRRLRSGDGVFFTKYGARKLAHYVEREIRRYMTNKIVSLPSTPSAPTAPSAPGKPSERPLAGPVVPLAAVPTNSEELLGSNAAGRVHGDALATQVLVKGEPIASQPGRADDFIWPPGGKQPPVGAEPPKKAPAPAAPIASLPAQPAPAAPQPATAPPAATAGDRNAAPMAMAPAQAPPAAAPDQEETKKKPQPPKRAEAKPHPVQHHVEPPRPPQPVQPQRPDPLRQLFGGFR